MRKFFEKWWVLLVFGSVVLVSTLGLRLVSDATYGEDSVVEKNLGYLADLSNSSPKSREYLESYFRKLGKREVMSKHWQHVCSVMTRLATDDKDATNIGFQNDAEYAVCLKMSKKMYFRDNLPM